MFLCCCGRWSSYSQLPQGPGYAKKELVSTVCFLPIENKVGYEVVFNYGGKGTYSFLEGTEGVSVGWTKSVRNRCVKNNKRAIWSWWNPIYFFTLTRLAYSSVMWEWVWDGFWKFLKLSNPTLLIVKLEREFLKLFNNLTSSSKETQWQNNSLFSYQYTFTCNDSTLAVYVHFQHWLPI